MIFCQLLRPKILEKKDQWIIFDDFELNREIATWFHALEKSLCLVGKENDETHAPFLSRTRTNLSNSFKNL